MTKKVTTVKQVKSNVYVWRTENFLVRDTVRVTYDGRACTECAGLVVVADERGFALPVCLSCDRVGA